MSWNNNIEIFKVYKPLSDFTRYFCVDLNYIALSRLSRLNIKRHGHEVGAGLERHIELIIRIVVLI